MTYPNRINIDVDSSGWTVKVYGVEPGLGEVVMFEETMIRSGRGLFRADKADNDVHDVLKQHPKLAESVAGVWSEVMDLAQALQRVDEGDDENEEDHGG